MTDQHPLGPWIEVMSIAVASVGGFVLGGWLLAAVGFVAVASIVITRALRRSRALLHEPEVPQLGELAPSQAMAMLSALKGRPLQSDALAKIEELEQIAKHAPERALARANELLAEQPRSVPLLSLCARLQFELDHPDAATTWSRALGLALDGGLNVLAAREFDRHAGKRERLELDRAHLLALGRALAARGLDDDAAWCRARAEV